MNRPPEADIILEIATELGVAPSFIEKDWYAVQVLKLLSDHSTDKITPVFSGGTSLSKGYGLIQRFSEDIDFQIATKTSTSRADRRAYREAIVDLVNGHSELSVDVTSIKSRDSSNFFSFNISYLKTQQLDGSLRTSLQLEMSFKEGALPVENRSIRSFVAEFTEDSAETNINCITPVKTAADKFSALLWRIIARDRNQTLGSTQNDPTIIRHLHDLSALEAIALANPNFAPMVHAIYTADSGRGGIDPELSLASSITQVQSIFSSEEKEYRSEYTRYVDAMSYAPDDEKIDFDKARASLDKIVAAL
jgi:predicted nucleotidyltransferase component of viral defense system